MSKTVCITAYPFVIQTGLIEVPDGDLNREELRNYIICHWGEIRFDEPEFDYSGAEFDVAEA